MRVCVRMHAPYTLAIGTFVITRMAQSDSTRPIRALRGRCTQTLGKESRRVRADVQCCSTLSLYERRRKKKKGGSGARDSDWDVYSAEYTRGGARTQSRWFSEHAFRFRKGWA